MEEEISLKEKINEIFKKQQEEAVVKKPMRMPRKGKVNGSKAKKGWIGILKINDNNTGDFEKRQVIDNTYKLKDGTYHALDGSEIIMIKGKKPMVIQKTSQLNPERFNKESNETYGQKYVMARMLGDTIKIKSSKGNIIIWLVGIGIAVFLISRFL